MGGASLYGENRPELSLLLIEDNPADAHYVEILLQSSDFYRFLVDTRASLAEGIAALTERDDYAAVLLDLTLPDSRGFETIERILSRFPDINLVVMTGLDDRSMGMRAVKAGAQDFLVKGAYDSDTLIKSLQYALARKQFLIRMAETQRLAHIGSWEFDVENHIFEASDEVYLLCGLDPVEKTLTYQKIVEPTNKCHVFIEMQEESVRLNQKVSREISLVNNDETTYIYIECRPYRNMQNQLIVYGFVQDVSERMRNEDLRKAKEVAEQSARMKEQLLAGISHEMRTPMNAIYGMSNLLYETQLNDEQTQLVDSVKQSSQILLGIINDILEISTLQNGVVAFEQQPFNLRDTLQNLAQVMEYKVAGKPVQLKLEMHKNLPQFISGDQLRLNQILNNLVGNAIKFTDNGSVTISACATQHDGADCVITFEVIDTGIGIPVSKLGSIFEAFSRVKNKDRLFEGTGLGLSIAKSMIEGQGGNISVESILGEGSRFRFYLPFQIADSIATETTASKGKDDFFKSEPQQKIHILLVEDHKMNQLVAKKTLTRKWPNCQISIADNGKLAIDFLINNLPDLILMDLQMPVMDGYETTEYIRTKMPAPINRLPIMAMTANAHISKDDEFFEKGFNNYVLKPFEPDELFKKIQQLLLP